MSQVNFLSSKGLLFTEGESQVGKYLEYTHTSHLSHWHCAIRANTIKDWKIIYKQ